MKLNEYIISEPAEKEWEDFVYHHPEGNIFQTPGMFKLYASVPAYQPGIIAIKDRDEELKGILSYNIIGNSPFTRRSIIAGGPLAANNDSSIIALLLKDYLAKIRKKNVVYTQVRNMYNINTQKEIFNTYGFTYCDHLTIHINLIKDEQALLREMHKKRSSNIKRALKKEIEIKELKNRDQQLELSEIITQTYRRIKLPPPHPALFTNAYQLLGSSAYMIGAYTKNMLIGGRFYVVYKHIIYDWYAGSDLAYSSMLPNDLLPWKGMLWAKEKGIKIYDFAGAGHPEKKYSVREYKKKFGGNIINTGRYLCIHNTLLYNIGKIGLQIYKAFKL